MHLFDIDVPGKLKKEPSIKKMLQYFKLLSPGKISFKESEVLSPGSDLASFETNFGARIGLGICYDIRFPDLAQVYIKLLFIPKFLFYIRKMTCRIIFILNL